MEGLGKEGLGMEVWQSMEEHVVGGRSFFLFVFFLHQETWWWARGRGIGNAGITSGKRKWHRVHTERNDTDIKKESIPFDIGWLWKSCSHGVFSITKNTMDEIFFCNRKDWQSTISMQVLNIIGDGQNCQNQIFKWLYQLNESKYEKSVFGKILTVMLFHMYQVFSSLQGHLHFSSHFFSTFMEQLFLNHPISDFVTELSVNKISSLDSF